jgi:purine catabolism regulator
VSLADTTEQVVLLPLLIHRRVRGYLAVGTPERLGPGERQLVNASASLLTLLLGQATAVRSAEGRVRTAVFRLLAQGDVHAARQPADDLWGGLPEEPISVLVLGGNGDARTNLAEVAEAANTENERVFFAEVDDRLVVLATSSGGGRPRLLQALRGVEGVSAGESHPVPLSDLARGHRQAEQALSAGSRLGRRHTAFSDIGAEGLLSLVSTPDGRAFAESLLRPVVDHDTGGRAALITSLRTWLEHNGHWDAAAASLGVHRHTLRSRMQRIEGILGRDLDSAGLRAELWTALQLLDEPAPG